MGSQVGDIVGWGSGYGVRVGEAGGAADMGFGHCCSLENKKMKEGGSRCREERKKKIERK